MLKPLISNQLIQTTEKSDNYACLDIEYEHQMGMAWYHMRPQPRPCCSTTLIGEIQHWFNELQYSSRHKDIQYITIASQVPGIFNLGGDLDLFLQLIRKRDRAGLLAYAISCIDTLFLNHNGLDRGITTISLVAGDALGGGLEYALSSHILIAERGVKMGMPEILFNLFPGMGAYSLLSRKIGGKQAEAIILSGRLYTAEEMHEMGVIDILCERGEGRDAVYQYIEKEQKASNGIRALRAAKRCTNPVTYEELEGVCHIWADAALNLRDKDLRMMERLVSRQYAKVA